MSYATPANMAERYPLRDLIQLTNEDPTLQTVNEARLQVHLNDASDKIDSYLATRFALPLQNVPRVLTLYCCTIAMYYLQNNRPIHDLKYAQERYNEAIEQLKEVKNGQLGVSLSANNVEIDTPQNPAVVQVDAGGGPIVTETLTGVTTVGQWMPTRIFSRGHLFGF